MVKAQILMPASVAPTCDGFKKVMTCDVLSVNASMIARRYGVLSVFHRPADGDSSRERIRLWSAHSLTVSGGGGRNAFRAFFIISFRFLSHFACIFGFSIDSCKFSEKFLDNFIRYLPARHG